MGTSHLKMGTESNLRKVVLNETEQWVTARTATVILKYINIPLANNTS
jgi:chorismate-pyruvate lyase